MLRITPSTSAAGAKAYYTQALRTQDYYSEKQEIPGIWHGRVAELMQLSGPVTARQFAALCDNRNPLTGAQLTPRTRGDRRVGYDFTFNAPKSVSVLYALSGDERIAEAVREAANATMREIEQSAATRVRAKGEDGERATGSLLWADFLHTTSRPVDGIPDPHLHVHAYAFNVTYDPVELRYKAAQFGGIKADGPYWEAAFHARLGLALEGIGYRVGRDGRYMAVAGVPESVVAKFSRRTAEIEEIAGKRGITGEESRGKLKAALGAMTRRSKGDITLTSEQLTDVWRSRLNLHEREAMRRVMAGESGTGERIDARGAVAYALGHSFERQSVADEKDVRIAALQRGFGQVGPDEVKRELDSAPLLHREKDGRRIVTTREVYDEEQAMLRFAREGRGVCRPLGPRDYTIANTLLGRDQLAAVTHVLSSRDRVTMIRGGAGTGKTTLLKEAVVGIEAAGRKVFAFAPTASAARDVLRAEGFATADTLWQLLHDRERHEALRGQVLLIDEAGLASARDMARVFTLAEELDARVVLVGDSRQHSAVARGDAMRLLEQKAGIRPAEVLEVVRQRGEYREAVSAISRGRVSEGFAQLERMGCIVETPGEERYRRLAADYLAAIETGRSALVVAPTHREAGHVTALLREALKDAGRLGREETPVRVLKPLHLTEAEAGDPASYREGYVLRFHQNARGGITRGQTLDVAAIGADGTPLLRDAEGALVPVPLKESGRFTVYRADTLGLSAGDTIRLNQNGFTADRAHRLSNGALYEVKEVGPDGTVTLTGGWQLAASFGGFDYGYVSTSHGSQGRTVDQVLIAQDSHSGRASSTEQFYVSVSRGRQQVRIYTDDKGALAAAVQRSSARSSASELMRGDDGRRRDWVRGLTMRLNRTLGQLAEAASRGRMPAAELMGRIREAGRGTAREFARGREADEHAR